MKSVQPELTEYVLDWYYGQMISLRFDAGYLMSPPPSIANFTRLYSLAGIVSAADSTYLGWGEEHDEGWLASEDSLRTSA